MTLIPFRDRRIFWFGLVPRLALIVFAAPQIPAEWFVPFIRVWLAAPSLDPWTSFLARGGELAAFPYGPAMFVLLLPLTALSTAAHAILAIPGPGTIGYGLTILVAEFICLNLLSRLQSGDTALVCLWLSPAVFILCYWHGQNDLVPVAFMLASLVALKEHRAEWSGAALGLAIIVKISMAVAAPIIAVYLFRNARLRALLPPFLIGMGALLLPQLAVFAYSPGARAMVLGTPEAQKVFQLALDLGGGLKIYVLPVVYVLVLFWVWRLRRITFDLALSALGIVFLLVALLTPATPNWFLWAIPFLAIHAARTGRRGVLLVFVISSLKALSTLLQFTGASVPIISLDATTPLGVGLDVNTPFVDSVIFSMIASLGIFVMVRMWQDGIRRNDLYRINKRPLIVGIAGDSGVGKDTLAASIAGLFGTEATASISGDDYHNWERARPMWRVMTHLHPRANDLERMSTDVLSLATGKSVSGRQYDHATGQFTKANRIGFNDVIIVSGLHALSIPALRARYDIQVFLDMDEELRRFFKLRRDVGERGHAPEKVLESIERRMPDSERFIRPQRAHADIIFSLMPTNREDISDFTRPGDVRLKLVASLMRNTSCEALVRVLIATCGLHVDVDFIEGSEKVELVVEGDVDAEDITVAARLLIPSLDELVALKPEWRGGMTGLMDLIVLVEAAEAMRSSETVLWA